MTDNRVIYESLVERFNKEAGTHIRLAESVKNVILPKVDIEGQTIRFNDRLETMMMLFILFMANKRVGASAIHHFLLYHLAIQRNMYGKAEELLSMLDKEVEKLAKAFKGNEAYNFLVVLQVSIALGHEMSHVYYALHHDLRENHIEAMRQRLISYREQLNTDKPLVIKLLHLISRKMKRFQERSFDEAIGNENLLEELCCDEAAWEMVKKLIESFDFDSDSMALACAHVGLSLAFMEVKRSLENIYINPGQEIRERDLRFDSSRHLMQNYIVWDYMDEVSKETSRQFQSLINDFERKGHTVLMLTLREEVEHIGYIRLMDPEKYSFQETKRVNAIYEGIDARIRKSVVGLS